MKGAQNAVKWLAIALAVAIIGGIISATMGIFWVLGYVFGDTPEDSGREMAPVVNVTEPTQISCLQVELKAANLRIVTGKELKVEANSEHVKSIYNGDTLTVNDEGFRVLVDRAGYEVVISVPKDWHFSEVKLDTGAGAVSIEYLAADRVELGLGAGKVEIGYLLAKRQAKINGGAGKMDVRDGEIANLELDMGVGKTSLRARLTDKAEIDAGVGKLELMLVGAADDYRVRVDKGLGRFYHEGLSLDNPNGKTLVDIDGGVGAVEVKRAE